MSHDIFCGENIFKKNLVSKYSEINKRREIQRHFFLFEIFIQKKPIKSEKNVSRDIKKTETRFFYGESTHLEFCKTCFHGELST